MGCVLCFHTPRAKHPSPQKLPPSVSGGLFEPIISLLISFETPEKETKAKINSMSAGGRTHKSVFVLQNMGMYLQILKTDVWSALGAVLGVTSWEKMALGCPSGPQCGCAERMKCRQPSRTRISSTGDDQKEFYPFIRGRKEKLACCNTEILPFFHLKESLQCTVINSLHLFHHMECCLHGQVL